MKAVAPWVYIRFIPGRLEAQGFFMSMGRKRRARQLRCHAACILFSLSPRPFSGCHAACIPCTKHKDVAVMLGAAVAGVPPASSPARRSPSPGAVMLRITPSGLPGPLPSAPRGLPLDSLCPSAVTVPRFATGLSRPWDSGFFLRSLRLSGGLALLGRPEAGLTSHRLRGVADDRCAATALPLRLVVPFLCPRPGRLRFAQTALAGVIAAIAVTRPPLRSGRDTSLRCFF
jgi:hypothetical protein